MHMEIFPSRRTNLNENWSAWNGGPLSGNPLTTKIRRTRGFAAFGPGSLETVQCEGV
jgi:hypothetical protein